MKYHGEMINCARSRQRRKRSSINCVHTMHFCVQKTWNFQQFFSESNFISFPSACMGPNYGEYVLPSSLHMYTQVLRALEL